MIPTPTTKTDDREKWRARIMRALEELQTDSPAIEQCRRSDGTRDHDHSRG